MPRIQQAVSDDVARATDALSPAYRVGAARRSAAIESGPVASVIPLQTPGRRGDRDGWGAFQTLHDAPTVLSAEIASTALAFTSLAVWALSFSAAVTTIGAGSLASTLASVIAGCLCSAVDRAWGMARLDGPSRLHPPLAAIGLALVAGALLSLPFRGVDSWPVAAITAAAGVSVGQALLFMGRATARRSGRFAIRVAVVGEPSPARAHVIHEFLQRRGASVVAVAALSDYRLIAAGAAQGKFDEVVLLGESGLARQAALQALSFCPIDVAIVDTLAQDDAPQGRIHWVQRQKQRGFPSAIKRLCDIVGALLCLVALAPVLLGIAIAIRLESPGGALFKQRRFGQNGQTFMIWKFRSMKAETSDPTGSKLTTRNDDRVTRVGAFLRRTSFDELPQLFNILTGDLSFVGPRPHPSGATANGVLYDVLIPEFSARYRVRPGLTGLAQCSGLRGNTDTEQKLIDRFAADMRYVENWSLGLDAIIVLRTIGHLLRGENAY